MRLVDYSDDDGPDFSVEDEFGEVARFFDRKEAERYLEDMRFVAAVDAELFGEN